MSIARDNIFFVLVRTQFASNLGSAVRVMKNMGISNLVLVQPQCEVGIEARSFAMKGAEMLDRALFCHGFEQAVKLVNVMVGTTGRFKGGRPRMTSPRGLARDLIPRFKDSRIGVAFGSEDNGLQREELALCQWLVEIPTGSDYPVINLAQAVAIVAYELNLAAQDDKPERAILNSASPEEVESLSRRIEDTLVGMQLPTRLSISRLMQRVSRVIGRAQLEREDVQMLHGLLKEVDRKLRDGSQG